MDSRLILRPKTIKLLEKKQGNKLFDFSLSNIFVHVSPQSRTIK